MADRTVIDSTGRTWTCGPEGAEGERAAPSQGQDVVLSCVTPSVSDPVLITVGWQWERMAAPGLARLISQVSPAPRR
jgi:hypothetical protein